MRTNFFYVVPLLAFFAIFTLIPAFWAFGISLQEYKIVGESKFVGLQNYSMLIQDPLFWNAFKNTILFVIVTVPGQIAPALLVASLLNQKIRGVIAFRTMYYIPVITSWVVVSVVWEWIFAGGPYGLANSSLMGAGIIHEPIAWFGSAATALPLLMSLSIWKGIGWSMVIFLAALQAVPQHLYDAAKVDGARTWRTFRTVTLPAISPVVAMVVALLTIGAFTTFSSVYVITQGGPLNSTEVLYTYMYKNAFTFLNFGYAAAIVFAMLPIMLGINLLQIKFLSKRE
jgi:multiple sugar transport system permease protein